MKHVLLRDTQLCEEQKVFLQGLASSSSELTLLTLTLQFDTEAHKLA